MPGSEPDEAIDCELCGAIGTVSMSIETETFQYGAGADAVMLDVQVPVWRCLQCGEAYVGSEAEVIRHEAVCRHLGRPTPAEIQNFRSANDLSQQQFAKLTGFGIEAIQRWESGSQIPSALEFRLLRP